MSGLYTGAMGMISNIRKVEVHGNNIANAATTGYKMDQETFRVFDETFKRSISNEGNIRIGQYHDEVYVDDVRTYFEQGSSKVTGNPVDFMLQDNNGSGQVSFFAVKVGDAEYLTRNGNFTLDGNRRLVTQNGGLVLGENNLPIVIPENVKFSVNSDGSITEFDTNKMIGKLKLQSVGDNDLQLLQKKQGGYYEVMSLEKILGSFGNIQTLIQQFDTNPTIRGVFGSKERLQDILDSGQVRILSPFQGQVYSGALETSNVDMASEMVGMMNAQKGVSSAQKVSSTFDRIFEKEANELGK